MVFMEINNVYNFFYHPLTKEHSRGIKILSIITIVALSILTAGLYLLAFAIVNLNDRKMRKVIISGEKKEKVPSLKKPPQAQAEKVKNLTENLLKDKNGFSFSPLEPQFHKGVGKYVGNVQGHHEFRREVSQMTQEDFHILSPEAIRKNREVNPNLSLILTIKRLGHALSLDQEIILEDNTSVDLIGFNEVFTIPMLAESFEKFAKQRPDLISEDMLKWVLENFTQSTRSDNISEEDIHAYMKKLKDPNFEGPLCVSSGYDWHLNFTIFYRNFVFCMNRGANPFELRVEGFPVEDLSGPGISLFRTDKPFDLSEKTTRKLFKRMNVRRFEALKAHEIQEELGLQFLDTRRSKKQKAGNCTYVSSKLAVQTLIALYVLRNHEKITTPDFDQAFDSAKKIYKEWVNFDRNYVVKDLREEISALRKNNQEDSMIYRTLYKLLNFAETKKYKLDPEVNVNI